MQQQPQDMQQLITMYAAMPDLQVVQPMTVSKKRWHSAGQGTQQVAKKHTSAIQKVWKAVAAVHFGTRPVTTHKPARTATQGQPQATMLEVQQLVADLIKKGPNAPCAGKLVTATSAGRLTAAMSMGKAAATMSTKIQSEQKMATVTAPDPSQVISIDDDKPMLTSNVTAITTSILDTVMMEEDESPRSKQMPIMQESVDKLLQGCRSQQDLQEKITMLTLEWDVAINNAVVNLHQYENL